MRRCRPFPAAPEAEARLPQVSDKNRRPLLLDHDRAGNVAECLDETHAADVETLRPHGERTPAHVGIALGQAFHHLIKRDVIAHELPRIELDVIFLRRAAERRDIDHPGHAFELAADLPILNRLEIREAHLLADQFVAIDFGDGRPGGNRRLNILRERDLLEAIQNLLPISKIVAVEREIHFDVAEPEDG
jgi:hypothetical protein